MYYESMSHLVMASRQKFLVPSDCGMVTAAMNNKFLQPLGQLEIEAKAFEEGLIFAWCSRDYS